jgi:hypothetical protein
VNNIPERHVTDEVNAPLFAAWIATRSGVAVWSSINLSNPGASWSTPALTNGLKTNKPTWEVGNEPERVITSLDEVDVVIFQEVKRFHVALRMGGQGLAIKVSDGGSRKIRKAVMQAGDGAIYRFEEQDAVIMKPAKTVTLQQWIRRR